jgi:hypothetical protein
MKSKTKASLGIVFLILLAGMLTYIFNPTLFSLTGVCGATTMSLGQATFSSTSSYWTGPQWILNVAFGGMCQSWNGYISAAAVASQSGQTPQNNFYMKIDMSKQECQYKVSKDSTFLPIWIYHYETWTRNFYESCTQTRGTRCGDGYLQLFEVNYDANGVLIFPYGCACLGRTPVVTSLGTLKTPVVSTESVISVSKDGTTYKSKTVKTPTGSSTVDFNDVGFPVVGTFNGYTSLGTCDDQYAQAANQFYTFYDAGWKLGSMNSYIQYVTAKSTFDGWVAQWQGVGVGKSVEVLKNRVNTINDAANGARYVRDTAFANANLLDTTGATYPYYTRVLITPVSTPLWTFYIKADWLGIVQPVPKASIESTAVTKCKSGEGGSISASVRNSGSAGNVNIWAICTAPFATSYSVTQMFSAGEVKTVSINFDVNTPSIVSSSCSICAKGYGEIGSGTCVTVSATCNPQYICEPMTRICEANNIKECRSDGSGWRIITSCLSTEECLFEGGQPVCKSKTPPITCGDRICGAGESCTNCPSDCGQCPSPDQTELYVLIGMTIASGLLIASMVLRWRSMK